MPTQVSQKRIAQAAGVSQATVSLILSGQHVASKETRERVLRAAEELKYRPNLLVRGMQTGRTQTVGVMVPPFDFHWSEVLFGIHDVLGEADHVAITLWSSHDRSGPWHREAPKPNVLEQVHRLLDRRIDGVILWPPLATVFQQHVEEFSSRDLPVVTIDHRLPARFNADVVFSDERQGANLVTDHLLSLGHRRLGHLAAFPNATWALERRKLFEQAVASADVGATITVEVPDDDQPKSVDVAARRLVDRPDRPTAIFAASDIYAKAVYRACRELGVNIPGDISVVGFSDEDFAEMTSPPLTTVRQPAYEIGRKSAELVLARILTPDEAREPVSVKLPVTMVVRESTAAPR